MRNNLHFNLNPDFDRLYIFGAGGHGREVAWLVEQSWGNKLNTTFVVDSPEFLSEPVNGIPVAMFSDVQPKNAKYVAGVGDPTLKRSIAKLFSQKNMEATRLVHPGVELSSYINISEGVVICTGCVLTVNIDLARHVHLNLDCTLSHDVAIGEFTTLSPGVHVAGNVKIGAGVFIGTGANIINGTKDKPLVIGDGAIIAAGSCVTKDVSSFSMVAGVPAIRKN